MRNTERCTRWLAVALTAVVLTFLLGFLSAPDARVAFGQTPSTGTPETVDADSAAGDEEDRDDGWDWTTERGDVVRMGESIEIGADEKVSGDVVAIGGAVTIWGHVSGDVVAIGGGLTLKSGCYVAGDAVSVGGKIEREEGAVVRGQEVSVGGWQFPFPKSFPFAKGRPCIAPSWCGLTIWWDFLRYAGFFLIGMIFYLAFPQRMDRIRSELRSRFWLSLVTGIGSTFGVIILVILLTITCIGILLAIPGIFVTILAMVAGGAITFSLFGELILRRPGTDRRSWILALAVGMGLVLAVQIIGRLLLMTGVVGIAIGGSLLAICKAAWFVLLMTGFGALVLSRLGAPPRLAPAIPVGAPGTTPPPPGSGSPPGPVPSGGATGAAPTGTGSGATPIG